MRTRSICITTCSWRLTSIANWTPDCLVCGRICSIYSISRRRSGSCRSAAASDTIRPSCPRWSARRGRSLPSIAKRNSLSGPDLTFDERKNVEVIHGDGCRDVGGPADVIIVHAGFTHPHPLWLDSLRPQWSTVGAAYQARQARYTVSRSLAWAANTTLKRSDGIEIFPCHGRGNTALDERLTNWWETASALAPLRFGGIAQGLPSNGEPRRRNIRG